MTDELKVEPCPLCNSERVGITAVRDGYEVWCRCGLSMTKHNPNSRTKAIEAWNTRAARPAPAEDAVLTEAMALHKRWKAAVARHDGLLQTHAVTHPAVVRSGQRCAGLYSQLSVAAIEALAAMQPRGEQQAGREATDA